MDLNKTVLGIELGSTRIKAVLIDEKHIPVAEIIGDTVKVSVGSVEHPMSEEHSILWVYLETESGGQRKSLEVGKPPVVTFALGGEKPVAVYAYCNLHGLWKSEL